MELEKRAAAFNLILDDVSITHLVCVVGPRGAPAPASEFVAFDSLLDETVSSRAIP